MHIIENGDLDQLEKFFSNKNSNIVLGYVDAKFANERAFIQRVLTLASLAAINGGVDSPLVYSMIFKYQSIIESINEPESLLSLAYDILKKFCQTVNFQNNAQCQTPVLEPILRYIHSNLHTKITVEEVARKMNISKNYLSRLFKQEIHENFSTYVLNKKIALAKHLMETTNKQISEISEYLVFSSSSHFCNSFKKITNMTPKQYMMKVKRL